MEILVNNNNATKTLQEKTAENASSFIESNTKKVSLEHLKDDCIIPVFSKDNESTISHYQFINQTFNLVTEHFDEFDINEPEIRVSHVIKGRIPSAIGKPAKDLLDYEKTIYYERCAFLINIPSVNKMVNDNLLTLAVGGVRAYNQENLYSKKSLEKFKVFIGFTNKVCTNLCVSTDGLKSDLRVGAVNELDNHVANLFRDFSIQEQVSVLENMNNYSLNESEFAHLIGRMRLYNQMPKSYKKGIFDLNLNDSQVNKIIKDYYYCPNFSRDIQGNLSLWHLYNLFTEANKSSYIDNYLERGLCAYEFVKDIGISLENGTSNWFLNN